MKNHNAAWVVYLMTVRNKPEGMRAVCEQSDWDAMESARPGFHKLIQGGIGSESEADKIARADQGNDKVVARSKSRWSQSAAVSNLT